MVKACDPLGGLQKRLAQAKVLRDCENQLVVWLPRASVDPQSSVGTVLWVHTKVSHVDDALLLVEGTPSAKTAAVTTIIHTVLSVRGMRLNCVRVHACQETWCSGSQIHDGRCHWCFLHTTITADCAGCGESHLNAVKIAHREPQGGGGGGVWRGEEEEERRRGELVQMSQLASFNTMVAAVNLFFFTVKSSSRRFVGLELPGEKKSAFSFSNFRAVLIDAVVLNHCLAAVAVEHCGTRRFLRPFRCSSHFSGGHGQRDAGNTPFLCDATVRVMSCPRKPSTASARGN